MLLYRPLEFLLIVNIKILLNSPNVRVQMCSERYRGAAVSALAVAHNLGILLMYLAADLAVAHRSVLSQRSALTYLHVPHSFFTTTRYCLETLK